MRKNKILLPWLLKTSGLLKDSKWGGLNVHAGRDWHPVYFEIDWVRYCEEELQSFHVLFNIPGVYVHSNCVLDFNILHARQSRISRKVLPCTITLKYYARGSVIIIKKYFRAPNLKMLCARQSVFYLKIMPCTIP